MEYFRDTVTLAHLNLAEGAMSAEVNSVERLKKLRTWLDTMPESSFKARRSNRSMS